MRRLLLLFLSFLALTAAAPDAPERLWVLNGSDRLFHPLRERILFSRRYRGNYYKQFPFRPLTFTEYRLKEGEDLYTIASALGISVDSIASASGIVFIWGTKPGDLVRIPDFQGLVFTASYPVSLAWVADRYNVSAADIRRFNAFRGTRLEKGQRLFLPGAHMTALEQALFYGTAFANPLPLSVLTSSFGLRRDPVRGTLAFHGGIDLAAPPGTDVSAAHDGVVEFCGWAGGYGNLVVLRHAFGYRTYYGHLSRIMIRPGQTVPRGRVLGLVGSTGYSTGPHLHFEIRHYSRQIDPLTYATHRHAGGRAGLSRMPD